MNIELNNISWFEIDGIRCIGFCDEGTIVPDKDCYLAVMITNKQFSFGRLEKTSKDKLVFNCMEENKKIWQNV